MVKTIEALKYIANANSEELDYLKGFVEGNILRLKEQDKNKK